MKKFTNARIYRQHGDVSEILVDKGVITQIGKNLPKADEEIDLRGRLVVPPYYCCVRNQAVTSKT